LGGKAEEKNAHFCATERETEKAQITQTTLFSPPLWSMPESTFLKSCLEMSNKADAARTQAAQKQLDRPYPSLQTAAFQTDAFQMKKKIVTAFKFKAGYTPFFPFK